MSITETIHAVQASASATSDVASVHQSEASIRSQLLRGDSASLLALCQRSYSDTLGCYCMAMLGDASFAARAARETWERLMATIDVINEQRTIRSAILGLARKRCAYLLESQAEVDATTKPVATYADGNVTTVSLAVAARSLLSCLRPTERELLVLRYVSNLTYEEIADICGVSTELAKLRVSRAIARCLLLSKESA
ncbi:MAG TPA: sigma-70 family RNA polymerase sigma factor [Polyangiaceae bacterium]